MTAASDWLEADVLNRYLVNGTPWVALFQDDASDVLGQGGSEITGGSYKRLRAQFALDSKNVARTQADLVWPGMPACTVGAVAIFTAETGGTMLFHGETVYKRTLIAGDTYPLPAGQLTVAGD